MPLGALGAATLAACGGEDAPAAEPIVAGDDGIALAEIPENATTPIDFGSQQPFAFAIRGTGEDIRVVSGYCTHNGCAVALEGRVMNCPCHGAQFDASDGSVISGPAPSDLPEVPVVIEDGVLRRA